MIYLLISFAVIVGLYGLHRAALWMERRGWIYYRETRGTGSALGNAALEVQSMLEPSARHVLEERQRAGCDAVEAGEPPVPGTAGGAGRSGHPRPAAHSAPQRSEVFEPGDSGTAQDVSARADEGGTR